LISTACAAAITDLLMRVEPVEALRAELQADIERIHPQYRWWSIEVKNMNRIMADDDCSACTP
jgi:hypothetical protein